MAVEKPTVIRAEGAPKHPVLSIIVPVYNVEGYLDACLDSLQAQTFSDIEMVCVNDGSPDGSREILAKRQKEDARIVIVDKPNGGLSSARNAGINAACGPYIGFLDADDRFTPMPASALPKYSPKPMPTWLPLAVIATPQKPQPPGLR